MQIFIAFLIIALTITQSIAQKSNLAEKLSDLQLKLVNKISIGSSPEEVKSKLGKPSAVEVGFPDSEELIFFEAFNPHQSGQLNYTTWFYYLSKKDITYTVYADTSYFINAEQVSIDLYNYYLDKDSVYYKPICKINNEDVPLDIYNYYLDKDSIYINSTYNIDYPPKRLSQKSSGSEASKKKMGRLFMKKESQEMKLGGLESSILLIRKYKKEYVLEKKVSQEKKVNKQHNSNDKFLPILCIIFERGTNVVASIKVYFQLL